MRVKVPSVVPIAVIVVLAAGMMIVSADPSRKSLDEERIRSRSSAAAQEAAMSAPGRTDQET